jgi:hypothetical protein
MKRLKTLAVFFCLLTVVANDFPTANAQVADDLDFYNESPSRLRGVIEKFSEDYGSLNRFYTAPTSKNRMARFRQFYADRLTFLDQQNFGALNHDEQIDYLLFANFLRHEIKELDRNNKQFDEMSALLPFAETISDLEDARRRLEGVDAAKTAAL